MTTSLEKGEVISRIRAGTDLDEIIYSLMEKIYKAGPIEPTVLEILAYFKLFQPVHFSKYEQEILQRMGLFFKNPQTDSLIGAVFDIYHQHLHDKWGSDYTPMQADILKQINQHQYFSFSSPTSTGKSFVFRKLILSFKNDVVIIVPSRALINEYFERIESIVDTRTVNVLAFVDRINTKRATRNIFILTPERARDLFKNKNWLNIDIVLFDEAQLSDEDEKRGVYFDSIVRRVHKNFPDAKIVFSQPFITNPEAQLTKNHISTSIEISSFNKYDQRNVGQIFYTHKIDNNCFCHFGINKKIMGQQKIDSKFDPIEKALQNGGSVLIYVAKRGIYEKKAFKKFNKYISLCSPITDPEALKIIQELKEYIGASNNDDLDYKSDMLSKLKIGVVVHHGSIPLAARRLLEQFTQKGFCRICFATSTLEQGINMPFDVVYLDRIEASKPLSVKNLIGRAGRSTDKSKFDFGSVIIRESAMSSFRNLLNQKESLREKSFLDSDNAGLDAKLEEFKEAIKSGEFSDEYNLPNKDLKRLSSDTVEKIIPRLLDLLFIGSKFSYRSADRQLIFSYFEEIYTHYLERDLTIAEKSVFETATRIMLSKIVGKTFSKICQQRYAYISRTAKRRKLSKDGRKNEADNLPAAFAVGYNDIPNQKLKWYSLFEKNIKAKDVDYDRVVYDTYDFLDKLIGFKLSDIFYAAFNQYHKKHSDERAIRLALLIKYGTENKNEIWLLRYGFSFEEIELLNPCVESIGEEEIVFNRKTKMLNESLQQKISRYY